MALSKAAEDLENIITCSVCFEKFHGRDPRTLPCLHSFCRMCLEQMYQNRIHEYPRTQGFITCPTCNGRTVLPQGSIANLKSFFVAGQVADALANITKSNEHVDMCICTRCRKKRDAIAYCFTCAHAMCNDCKARHDQPSSSHVTVLVDKTSIHSLVCNVHTEFAEDFCLTCKIIVCAVCHSTTHKGHDCRQFVNKKDEKCLSELRTKYNQCSEALKKLDSMKLSAVKQVKDNEDILDKKVDEIINQVMDQAQHLRHKMSEDLGVINNSIKTVNAQKVIVRSRYIEEVTLNRPMKDFPDISVEYNGEDNDDPVATVPTIQIQPLRLTTVDVRLVLEEAEPHDFIWEKRIPVRCVEFLPNGNMIVISGDGRLLSYNQSGNSVPLPAGTEELVKLWTFAVHHASHNLTLMGQNNILTTIITKVEPWQSVEKKLTCDAIDFSYTPEGHIVVVYHDGLLQKYTDGGEKLWEKQLGYSCDYMTVNTNGDIIISGTCKSTHTLNVYDSDGTELSLPRGHDTTKLMQPEGLCTDNFGNVYVVDSRKGAVSLFDRNFVYINDVVTDIDVTGVNGMGVAVYEDKIAVCCDSIKGSFIRLYPLVRV